MITISGTAAATLTVTDLESDPPGPNAVAVNVRVSISPVNGSVPLRPVSPKFELRLVALVVLQVNVVDPPFSIDEGDAERVSVGGSGCGAAATVSGADAVLSTPSALRTVMENVLLCV